MLFTGNTRLLVRTLSSRKSKFTSNEIKQVMRRNQENDRLFGPILPKQALLGDRDVTQKDESKFRKTTESDSTKHKPNNCPNGDTMNSNSSVIKVLNNDVKNHVHDVLPGFSKDELKLPEHERLVLSSILNMPLFGDCNQDLFDLWKNAPIPSVSKVIRDSMSEESLMILKKWENKMIADLGIEGFEKYKINLFSNGTQLHSCIENFLKTKKSDKITSGIEGYWNSLQHALKNIDNVIAIEQKVTNAGLHYKGIADCIATYKGRPCLIDWKTSQKRKPTIGKTYDQPLQLIAYLSAFNNSLQSGSFDNTDSINHEVLRKLGHHKDGKPLENCLLVVLYENGSDADVHLMNKTTCLKYWPQWTQRVHKYWFEFFMNKYEQNSQT